MHHILTAIEMVVTGHQQGLIRALEDIPISIGRCGATCSMALTEEEIAHVVQVLDIGPQRTNTMTKFIRGDFWNSLPKKYGDRKKMLRKIYPHSNEQDILRLYRDWKQCGSVATKWPLHKRDNKVSWTWWRLNKPRDGSRIEEGNTTATTEANGSRKLPSLPGDHSQNVLTTAWDEDARLVFADVQHFSKVIPVMLDLSHIVREGNAALGEEELADAFEG